MSPPERIDEPDDGRDESASNRQVAEIDVTETALEEIGRLVPEPQRERVLTIVKETVSASHHSGPLPRPADMAGYEAIQTGFAERIMKMAESEQGFRHGWSGEVIKKDYDLKRRGQDYALIGLVILAAIAVGLIYAGDTEAAKAVVVYGIVAVVGVFITGRYLDSRDAKSEKLEDKPDKEIAE